MIIVGVLCMRCVFILFMSICAFAYALENNETHNEVSKEKFRWIDYNANFNDKKHLAKIVFAQDFSGSGFSRLSAIGLHYGQPNTFFGLPARMVLELEGFLGSGSEKALNQLIFGVSQDIVLSIPRTNFYAGVGIGIYIRTLLDSRMNSAFTFGEKVFIGYNYAVANKGGGGVYPVRFL